MVNKNGMFTITLNKDEFLNNFGQENTSNLNSITPNKKEFLNNFGQKITNELLMKNILAG